MVSAAESCEDRTYWLALLGMLALAMIASHQGVIVHIACQGIRPIVLARVLCAAETATMRKGRRLILQGARGDGI